MLELAIEADQLASVQIDFGGLAGRLNGYTMERSSFEGSVAFAIAIADWAYDEAMLKIGGFAGRSSKTWLLQREVRPESVLLEHGFRANNKRCIENQMRGVQIKHQASDQSPVLLKQQHLS